MIQRQLYFVTNYGLRLNGKANVRIGMKQKPRKKYSNKRQTENHAQAPSSLNDYKKNIPVTRASRYGPLCLMHLILSTPFGKKSLRAYKKKENGQQQKKMR